MDTAPPAPTIDPQCANCGAAPLVGPYCHECGQQAAERVTFRSIADGLREQFTTLDFAALRTLKHATLRPGRLAQEYIEGRRSYYTNPLAYALATATIYAVSIGLMDFEPMDVRGLLDVSEASDFFPAMVAGLGPGIAYLTIIALLPTAWLQRLLAGRRSNHNSAECYIFLLFAWSQALLVTAAIVFSGYYATSAGFALSSLAGIGIPAWGIRDFHNLRLPWALGAALILFWVTIYALSFMGVSLIYLLSIVG